MWLKLVLLSTLIGLSLTYSETKRQKCKELEECVKGENDVSCVKRYKRHCQSSSNSCNDCDCNYCSNNDCSTTCNTCCANFVQPCSTNYCCYKTCHAQCVSSTCRKSCRSSCTKKVQEGQKTSVSSRVNLGQAVNVTTVINLHNKINNTNEIDIPINVNSTNYNNFTIDAQSEYQARQQSGQPPYQIIPSTPPDSSIPTQPPTVPPQQSCCQLVGPRQCIPQPKYPFTRCFHIRRRECGPVCASPIMHAQQHQVCDMMTGRLRCHKDLIYIPQPQTRCTYQQGWPYVNCGVSQPNCEGCYGQFVPEDRKQSCSPSCFQDPFENGQYYRQGPVFGQGFPNNPMYGAPYQPNYEFGYSMPISPEIGKRSNHDSNAINPQLEATSFKPVENGNNDMSGNSLPIQVIEDGVSINEIPSSFMPYQINPYGQYPPYPYLPPPPYPYGPQPYPFIPPLGGEGTPIFPESNYQYKRGADDKSLHIKLKGDDSSSKQREDENESNRIDDENKSPDGDEEEED